MWQIPPSVGKMFSIQRFVNSVCTTIQLSCKTSKSQFVDVEYKNQPTKVTSSDVKGRQHYRSNIYYIRDYVLLRTAAVEIVKSVLPGPRTAYSGPSRQRGSELWLAMSEELSWMASFTVISSIVSELLSLIMGQFNHLLSPSQSLTHSLIFCNSQSIWWPAVHFDGKKRF